MVPEGNRMLKYDKTRLGSAEECRSFDSVKHPFTASAICGRRIEPRKEK
jgi:hypothetical protein